MHIVKQVLKRLLAILCVCGVAAALLPSITFVPTVDAAESILLYEDFEGLTSLPEGWTAYDADGDGYNWHVNTGGYNGYPNGGQCLESTSANSQNLNITPNEYLVLPAVTLPAMGEASVELSFQIFTSYMPGYADYIRVYVSTTPVTDPTTLTVDQIVLDEKYYSGNEYEEMTADLNAYRGQTVYIVFHHHTAKGVWQQFIDDVTVTAKEPTRHLVKFPAENRAFTVTPHSAENAVIDGMDFAFDVTVNSGYNAANGTLTVKANGEEIVGNNGTYTLKAVTEKQRLEIDFAYAPGDVNGDGNVNTMDALRLYADLNGSNPTHQVARNAGNIDYRAEYTMMDALLLYAYASGKRGYIDENRNISLIWKNDYADTANGFSSLNSIKDASYYYNNRQIKDYSASPSGVDAKQIFRTGTHSRVVNLSSGYAMTLPFTEFEADYALSELRSRYVGEDFVLNVSCEDQNPYGNTATGWNIYLTEWLERYIANDGFLGTNGLSRVRATSTSTTKLAGYTVKQYDVVINDNANIEMPYYHVAVIRKNNEYVKFYLLVMKSKTARQTAMDTIVKSFKELTPVGTVKNAQGAFACEIPDEWNEETRDYYNKLMTQSATDWGFFSASMVETTSSSYQTNTAKIQSEYDRLSSTLDYDYEIMPTYTHIGWGSYDRDYFPLEHANRFAGGNGFNGKPVLQFTYQFTTSNNTNLEGYTPMFDILRGELDDHFRLVAQGIKKYGKPVLFRLNNEMNTDWTSYAGIVSLLDPDIFAMTWERLYRIFEEEGVDNCIWIFNPIAGTTPYCDWGEYLCYMPDPYTVHALGLTAYENANGSTLTSFEDHYRKLYAKNTPYFDNYPAIISEFAAGAGGERIYDWGSGGWKTTTLGRNAAQQAKWVEAMFECFAHRDEPGYEFVKNIKGAVWFSVNDYATIDGQNYITNYLHLDSSLTATLAALKKGLANEK